MSQENLGNNNQKPSPNRSKFIKQIMFILFIIITIGTYLEIKKFIYVINNLEEVTEVLDSISPGKIVDLYLQAVISGDKSQVKALVCNSQIYSNDSQNKVKNFKVIKPNIKKIKDGGFAFYEIETEQEIITANNQTKLVKKYISVWPTDEHYSYFTKKYSKGYGNTSTQIERKDWSSNPFCIVPDENRIVGDDLFSI
ncbi:hypothetical protein NIES267_58100 [Calothrix parasitica NIES-267]|uniref:Uncharacterized protein n=1 Tax=Calothrix parasitica NIES-267 TaxID=1973488 RepID=A0A1Z4LYL5_9CYAN|nr:hypothetical protein NIES267_58100 [Calothrix parasitica NIES-267]